MLNELQVKELKEHAITLIAMLQNRCCGRRQKNMDFVVSVINKLALVINGNLSVSLNPQEQDGLRAIVQRESYELKQASNGFIQLLVDSGSMVQDDNEWRDQIPQEIKIRWNRFSPSLQEHIKNCIKAKLDERMAAFGITSKLGETYRSPISLDQARIPVRLPNKALGQSNEVYNLIDILRIETRDPENPSRRDPMTREYFTLDQVIPDPDAKDELEKRLDDANEKERIRPRAG